MIHRRGPATRCEAPRDRTVREGGGARFAAGIGRAGAGAEEPGLVL